MIFENKKIIELEKQIKNLRYLIELGRIISVRNNNLIELILKEFGYDFEFIDNGLKPKIFKKEQSNGK